MVFTIFWSKPSSIFLPGTFWLCSWEQWVDGCCFYCKSRLESSVILKAIESVHQKFLMFVKLFLVTLDSWRSLLMVYRKANSSLPELKVIVTCQIPSLRKFFFWEKTFLNWHPLFWTFSLPHKMIFQVSDKSTWNQPGMTPVAANCQGGCILKEKLSTLWKIFSCSLRDFTLSLQNDLLVPGNHGAGTVSCLQKRSFWILMV